jgi:UDP-N-acetylmuramoyl-tripeptide--D-alanyl-D-alanine ligase
MIDISVKQIADIAGGKLFSADPGAPVERFFYDSRRVPSKGFFIAIKGKNFDGNDYIADIVSKGAAGVVCENELPADLRNKFEHVIVVGDTIAAMTSIAKYVRNTLTIPVIAITGTNGKTTTKDILRHILGAASKTHANVKSFNNILGVCFTALDMEKDTGFWVQEIGTNHFGEIDALASIVRPTIAVMTNIGNGHLEAFGTKDGVFTEKSQLLRHVDRTGKIFLNADDPYLSKILKSENIRYYGKANGCDHRIGQVTRVDRGQEFFLGGYRFFIPLEGEHNVYNAAAAISVAIESGMSNELIAKALAAFTGPVMRTEKIVHRGVNFINDAYNANPDSFEAALQVLANVPASGKKIVVAGDMMELGPRAAELHEKIGESIAMKGFDRLISVGVLASSVAEGAVRAGMPSDNVHRLKDNGAAAETLRTVVSSGDTVLVKGSRSSKIEEIVQCFITSYTR